MKRLLVILVILVVGNICEAQTNMFGLYIYHDSYRPDYIVQLDLRPDFTYYFGIQAPGVGRFLRYSGVFTINSDTVFLGPSDHNKEQQKFLFVSHIQPSFYGTTNFPLGSLAKIFKSDTILSANTLGKLSDNEGLFVGSYIKMQDYYNDGKVKYRIEKIDNTKIITNYFASGQIQSIEHFYKERKKGNWYFYDEKGKLEKIEIYKRDKLMKVIKNYKNAL